MPFAKDRLEAVILFGVPALIVLLGCAAGEPRFHVVVEVLDYLAAWTCTSIPLAVLIGHCALGSE